MICFSSASFTFENLYRQYLEWRKIIYNEEESSVGSKYFIVQLSYEALPPFMMNQKVIQEALAGGASNAAFQREYCAQFTDGSDSYFSAKKMKECTVEDGLEPTILLEGEKDKRYALAIDPSFSNAPNSDHFAMSVLEMNQENPDKSLLVHNYAIPGGDLRDHIVYLHYILTHFNIEFIIIDNAGFGFIDSSNESDLFKNSGIKLSFIDFDNNKEGIEYQIMLKEVRNNYNKQAGRICVKFNFTTDTIRKANEHLQTCIDHKKIGFSSKISAIQGILEKWIDKEAGDGKFKKTVKDIGYENIMDFIDTQSHLINLTKDEAALIEVKSTVTGAQSFSLPVHLARDNSKDRVRKDSYTSLMLGCWAIKIYNDFFYVKQDKVQATFTPFVI